MDHESFNAFVANCKKAWLDFTASVDDPELKSFLKKSYAVLTCPKGQINLDSTDFRTIALESPESFIPNHASAAILKCLKDLEDIKKEFGEEARLEKKRLEKKLQEFDANELNLEEHQLEVRFASLSVKCIQAIKRSSFVDSNLTSMGLASIRVVLKVPDAP